MIKNMEILNNMKKVVILILVSSFLYSCTEPNTKQTSTDLVVSYGNAPLKIVEVDGCEYLFGEWGNATVLTHKGNCKFCKERNKN